MGTISFFSNNILEDGTVTVTGEDTNYPKERLWDRSTNLYWIYTATGAIEIHIDQGESNIQAVDMLYVSGHNWDGEDITWEYSTDDSNWDDAVTGWTQSGDTPIEKSLSASLTKRYWKITVTSIENPMAAEIIMATEYKFDYMVEPNSEHDFQANVSWIESIGGQERGIKLGEDRRVRRYTLRLNSADTSDWDSMIEDLNGFSYPFLFLDDDSEYFMARFTTIPKKRPISDARKEIDFHIKEML